FDGNGHDDIFWYAPGSPADYVWWTETPGTFTSVKVSVGGHYEPLVVDVDGDGRDDVVWSAASGADYVWRGSAGRTFSSSNVSLGAGLRLIPLDVVPGGGVEVAAFSTTIFQIVLGWDGSRLTPVTAFAAHPNQRVVVGRFGGSGTRDDVLLYGPGSTPDALWLSQPGGGYDVASVSIS